MVRKILYRNITYQEFKSVKCQRAGQIVILEKNIIMDRNVINVNIFFVNIIIFLNIPIDRACPLSPLTFYSSIYKCDLFTYDFVRLSHRADTMDLHLTL